MKDLVVKSKEQFALIFIIVSACFLVFYWTHLIFKSYSSNIKSETKAVIEKIGKVENLLSNLQTQKYKKSLKIDSSLLAFMQNQTKKMGFEEKLIVLKPKTETNGLEGATVRFEKFNLNDFVALVSMLDRYENIQIDSFNLTKRFDNPKLANITMELSKSK